MLAVRTRDPLPSGRDFSLVLTSLCAPLQSYNPWDVGVRVLRLLGAADTEAESLHK